MISVTIQVMASAINYTKILLHSWGSFLALIRGSYEEITFNDEDFTWQEKVEREGVLPKGMI